jgi:hypothetical protein
VAAPTAQPGSSTACPYTTPRRSQGQPLATQPLGWVQASQGPYLQPFAQHPPPPPPSHSICREGDTQWSQHQPGVRLLCPKVHPLQGHMCNPTGSAATATFPSYSRGHIGQRDPPRAGNLVAAMGVQQLPRQVPGRHVCPLTHPQSRAVYGLAAAIQHIGTHEQWAASNTIPEHVDWGLPPAGCSHALPAPGGWCAHHALCSSRF